jgi:hypothetical protein
MPCLPPFPAQPAVITLTKQPSADVILTINWSAVIGDGAIASSAWSVFPTGQLTVTSPGDTDGQDTSTVLGDGDQSQIYQVTNTITVTLAGAPTETLVQKCQVYVNAEPTIFVYEPT